MTPSEIVVEVARELERFDLDARIENWVQRAINRIYTVREWSGLQDTYTFNTVASTRSYDLPEYFAKMYSVAYDSGGGSGHRLTPITLGDAEILYHGSTTSGIPYYYWLKGGKIYLEPIPSGEYTITVQLYRGSPNLFLHNINLTDDDSAAANGVALYIDEDAVSSGVGKFYFVSPTTTNGIIRLVSANNHQHNLTIYHSANAATLGVAVFFDENGSKHDERLIFDSPTERGSVAIQTLATREHTHYVQCADGDTSNGVAIYVDEDAADKAQRLLFVSPTNASGSAKLILNKSNGIFPFIEAFHELIYLKALQYGQLWNKLYDEANSTRREYNDALAAAILSDASMADARPRTREFQGGLRQDRTGEWWKRPGVKY